MLTVFITMQADPDMKMRAWAHAIEELMVIVAQAVAESEWKETVVYGPDSGTFSFFPNVCIEAKLPVQVVAGLRDIIDDNPWLHHPVTVHITRGGWCHTDLIRKD